MNQRRHITLVAAAATLLAATPLTSVFATWAWFVDVLIAVITTTGVALIVRNLRVAAWIPTVATTASLLLVLTWLFHSGHELLGVIPTAGTFSHFHELLVNAGNDMRDMGVPVADRDGLLFLSTLGIGAVAVVIDLFTVVMRRPALAGLPMLAVYSVPVAVHEDSVSFVPFAAGAAGFLWLLATDNVDRIRRFGRRFTGDGRDVGAWEPSPLAAAGRRLAVVGVAVAIALPMALPGRNGGLLDRFGAAGGSGLGDGRGGNGSSVDLYAVLSGELNNNRTFDMVKVQTDDPNPYYLRFGVADEVTPAGFRNRRPNGGQPATAALPLPVPPGSGITLNEYRAQVQIISLNMNSLPIYLQPTRTDKLDASWLYDRTDQLIYSRQSNTRGKKYTFDYVHAEYDPQALRGARPLDATDPVQRLYTTVPKVPEVERKLAQIISGQFTPYDKVRAIHNYFSAENGFRYSLQTKNGTSGSAIVDFLNNKQGFCEQYSAAMAWLVRAAGIPARVAFGFSRGSNQGGGDTWTLTNRNLHAWTEVYFDQFGWVPFDATPAAFVGGVDSAWAPDPNRPQNAPGATSPRDDLPIPGGPNQNAAAGASGAARPDQLENNAGPTTVAAPASPVPAWAVLGVLAALALLLAPAMWRGLRRRRRRPDRIAGLRAVGPPTPATTVAAGSMDVVVTDEASIDLARRRAHAAWDELIDTMIDYRLPVDLASTPRVTSERLIAAAALDEWAATGARLLGHAEERARYARQPLRSDDLTGSLRAVRDAIRQRVSWRTRVRAVFLPASVLGRWQAATGVASSGLVSAIGRRWDSTVRAVSPRRLLPGRR